MKKLGFLFVLPLILCGCNGPSNPPSEPEKTSLLGHQIDKSIKVYDLNTPFDIHTDFQNEYLLNEDVEAVPTEADGKKEYSVPNPVELEWEFKNKAEEYEIFISEDQDFKEYETFTSKEDFINIYNLKIATDYYYAVKDVDKNTISRAAKFSISDSGIRNLKIDGVTNSRDIGGKILANGKRIKQGNIFRTAKVDNITASGKEEMKRLGVKTEIDLRDVGTLSKSPLEGVTYYSYKMYYDDWSNYLERNCEPAKNALKVFANKDNYPIIYHCRIGTDRTGIITYLLLGLLGADIETINRDYLFSNYGVIEDPRTLHGTGVNSVELYREAVNAFPGETLQERIFNFLISIGMSEEELEAIIELNTENVETSDLLVLDGNRPVVYNPEEFVLDDGLTVSGTSIKYVDMDGKANKGFNLSFEVEGDAKYAAYFYMYTKNITTKASDAFKLTIDNNEQTISSLTFNDLHYRKTSNIYVAARLANIELEAGIHNLRMINIANDANPNALGAYVARVIIIPTFE